MSGAQEIRAEVARRMSGATLGIVEGNKGLYDGLDLDGSNSNAALAALIGTPVVLVIDTRGMTRGIAPLILGYQAFDPTIRIAGVILNQLGGTRHEAKLRAVIRHYTDVPVLGAVQHDERMTIVERHLGLVPSNEAEAARMRIDAIAALIADQVDLDEVLRVARQAPPLSVGAPVPGPAGTPVRLGIARDAAFGFYYPGDLEALHDAGAQLVAFDTLHDERLPAIDGLFIGGGFPETHMDGLAANGGLCAELRTKIDAGLPTYVECGGLMYLAGASNGTGAASRWWALYRPTLSCTRVRSVAATCICAKPAAGCGRRHHPVKARSSGRMNFTIPAWRTSRPMSGSPTTSSAATASTAATTASCTGTCLHPMRICATSTATTGRGASSSSSGAANPPSPVTHAFA